MRARSGTVRDGKHDISVKIMTQSPSRKRKRKGRGKRRATPLTLCTKNSKKSDMKQKSMLKEYQSV